MLQADRRVSAQRPDGDRSSTLPAPMESVLNVVQVVISVVLIFLVLLHSGKDAGLSGAFGIGADRRLGRRRLAGRAQPRPLDDLLRDPVRAQHARPAEDLTRSRPSLRRSPPRPWRGCGGGMRRRRASSAIGRSTARRARRARLGDRRARREPRPAVRAHARRAAGHAPDPRAARRRARPARSTTRAGSPGLAISALPSRRSHRLAAAAAARGALRGR